MIREPTNGDQDDALADLEELILRLLLAAWITEQDREADDAA